MPKYESPDEISQEEIEENLRSSKYPSTSAIPRTSLDQLFRVPENQQYTYASFTEEFEKYKVRVDLFKWLIGTVGLTIITYIINWGFKDREQGIAELEMYDRYATEKVVYKENPINRMLLAQFFANVTPSEKLRSGWKDYLDVTKKEVDSFNSQLKGIQELSNALAKDTNQSQQAKMEYLNVKKKQDELERIASIKLVDDVVQQPTLVESIGFRKTTVANRNENQAKDFEAMGYKALLSKNIEMAIYNFKMSENSFNGYHMSYDIAKFLEGIKTDLSGDDDWKEIYRVILQKYTWKMPKEIKEQVTTASK